MAGEIGGIKCHSQHRRSQEVLPPPNFIPGVRPIDIFIRSTPSSSLMARYYHEYSDTLVENAVAEVRITIDDAEVLKLYLNGPAPGRK